MTAAKATVTRNLLKSPPCLKSMEPPTIGNLDGKARSNAIQNAAIDLAPPIGWEIYRLGDMVANATFRASPRGMALHCRRHNKSLACEYMQAVKNSGSGGDYPLLLRLMRKRLDRGQREWKRPPGGTLVVHVRLGDKLMLYQRAMGAHRKYPTPENSWETIAKCAGWAHVKKIDLVSSAYINTEDPKDVASAGKQSAEYIVDLTARLQSTGFKVSWSLGGCPDHAFVFLAATKYFMQSIGTFSQAAAALVTLRKRHVCKCPFMNLPQRCDISQTRPMPSPKSVHQGRGHR